MDLKSFTAQSREAQHQGINGVYHAGMFCFCLKLVYLFDPCLSFHVCLIMQQPAFLF